jgi:hypothetical protein
MTSVPPLRSEHRGWDTVAFYLNQKGDKVEAVKTLKGILEKYPQYKDAEMLLKEIAK